ncbi:sigma-70 family RNA polymerase sigma factor [soil metagenome]
MGWLDGLRDSEPDAWQRMVRAYGPLIRVWLKPRGLQDADIDDITQKILAVIGQRIAAFDHNGNRGAFRAWLRGIAVNILREHFRSNARHAEWEPLLDELAVADSEWTRRWDADHDRQVLAGLMDDIRGEFAPDTWTAFVRTALQEENPAIVAAERGMTPNAVRIARSRVLARLRIMANGFFPEPVK